MRITERQLRRLIREEILMQESPRQNVQLNMPSVDLSKIPEYARQTVIEKFKTMLDTLKQAKMKKNDILTLVSDLADEYSIA